MTGDFWIDVTELLSLDEKQRGAFYASAQDWPEGYRWSVFDMFDGLRGSLQR